MPPPRSPPRKADGAAPNSATPNDGNIYIPSFIANRPFYALDESDQTPDYLQHQRNQHKVEDSKWYDRGRKAGPAATKYRKGACENCGAMTHKAKDCLSRPRAKGAKWTGKDIQADEVLQDVKLSWDAKRDRWNGFDPKDYRAVVEDYNEMEALRKQAQGEKAEEDDGTAEVGKKDPAANKRLRIREDTAKYLLNLDLESATFNPKTRALVDAGATDDKAAQRFAEESFIRASGAVSDFEKAQKYAWETQEKTGDTTLHLQANPTGSEFFHKKEQEAAAKKKAEHEKMLLEKYGSSGVSSMPDALKNVVIAESEHFVEYDETGLVKGSSNATAKSKYAEDIMINNHTSVWGSWWSNFKWGYSCCHSFLKNSYCTGETGKTAYEEAERQRTGVGLIEEGPTDEDPNATTNAPEQKDDASQAAKPPAKKRTAEEMMGGVTEEELDEYRKRRTAADDPMAKYLGGADQQ